MSPVTLELHIHSCLSPCGEDDMTPATIAGLCALAGVQVFALTDHNTARNCPAAEKAARAYGIGFIPGMEVTTAEDIHAICLFPSVEAALGFDQQLYSRLMPVPNRPEVFGNQLVMDENDCVIGREGRLLISATGYSILELGQAVQPFGGIMYPAHVDKEANGLLAILGSWPPELKAPAAEIARTIPPGLPEGLRIIRASDAHMIPQLPEEPFCAPLPSPDFAGLAQWLGVSAP